MKGIREKIFKNYSQYPQFLYIIKNYRPLFGEMDNVDKILEEIKRPIKKNENPQSPPANNKYPQRAPLDPQSSLPEKQSRSKPISTRMQPPAFNIIDDIKDSVILNDPENPFSGYIKSFQAKYV